MHREAYMCTKDFLRARARAGFGAGCAAAHVVAHVCPSSKSVPRAASSAASSCSCKQWRVASPVGPWAGGARAGLTGAVRGAAAAHAIDAVLLLHHDRQHVVLHLPCDRRRPWWRVAHLWWGGGRACSSGLGGAVWSGAAYHRHVQRVEREEPRDHAVRVARAVLPACTRFISDRHTHLAL